MTNAKHTIKLNDRQKITIEKRTTKFGKINDVCIFRNSKNKELYFKMYRDVYDSLRNTLKESGKVILSCYAYTDESGVSHKVKNGIKVLHLENKTLEITVVGRVDDKTTFTFTDTITRKTYKSILNTMKEVFKYD